jgi:cell division protein YceG involved in septum cleavage
VLNYSNTDYYFYLHDNSWNIHFGKTNAEHNANKAKYLN